MTMLRRTHFFSNFFSFFYIDSGISSKQEDTVHTMIWSHSENIEK